MSAQQLERMARRRRLLKAAAGVPAAYTLTSGVALAASSSLACIARGAADPATTPLNPPLLSTAPDSWVRARFQVYRWGSNRYIQVNNIWYQLNSDGTATAASPNLNAIAPVSGEYRYALMDYNTGTVGIYPEDAVMSQPVAYASCWNSITGTQSATVGTNLYNLIP